ncbi:hypothetical protein GH714_039170 [Hevea brasiliensis]|uniref:CCHC-type domain-containing protein n=1 Tax=Hevea brasiliensis TaxID=3981 RepID=A0A6A6L0H2_HEVBR|nr:hypothetical protein GH714_039170 [Hevea brasiliensis]
MATLSGFLSGDNSQPPGEDANDRGTKRVRFQDDAFKEKLVHILVTKSSDHLMGMDNFCLNEFLKGRGCSYPWVVLGHYLMVRAWNPSFVPKNCFPAKIVAWVQLPGLLVHYYSTTIVHAIGSKLGKVIKVDECTLLANRGKFARIAVELDILKPLYAYYTSEGETLCIKYQNLLDICFKCGKMAHIAAYCVPVNSSPITSVQNEGVHVQALARQLLRILTSNWREIIDKETSIGDKAADKVVSNDASVVPKDKPTDPPSSPIQMEDSLQLFDDGNINMVQESVSSDDEEEYSSADGNDGGGRILNQETVVDHYLED